MKLNTLLAAICMALFTIGLNGLFPVRAFAAVPYEYTCSRGEEVTYSFYEEFFFTYGESVTFTTAPVLPGENVDTVMYLFKVGNPENSS